MCVKIKCRIPDDFSLATLLLPSIETSYEDTLKNDCNT